jgi:cytochrome c peroxidase
MGGHHSWRESSAKVIVLGACLLAPSIVFSQGPPPNAPAAPPPVTSEPDPSPKLSPSQLDSLAVRGLIFASNGRPRRLADMVMRVPPDNPITDAKAALGRRLFFDRLLSNDRSVSCATCHDPARAFTDERPLAAGVFGRVGRRHSPSLVNRGFGRTQFWDGRAATLEALAVQPIPDPNEMDLSLDDAVARLVADASYRAEFQTVFERSVSIEDVARALATYLRTIRSEDSPYDRFVAGDPEALTAQQQLGLRIFRSKGRCIICHGEPMFTDDVFHNTGVAWRVDPETSTGVYQDQGRFQVTGLDRDRGKFKTPTLREVARTAPYMHDGSLATLADVMEFYNTGGRSNPNLFPLVRPLNLLPDEKQALVAFLESLSGTVTGR